MGFWNTGRRERYPTEMPKGAFKGRSIARSRDYVQALSENNWSVQY